jgi:cytochrome c peroxidase
MFISARLLVSTLVLAGVATAALAQESYRFRRPAMVEPHYPAQRWDDSVVAALGQKLFFDVRLSRPAQPPVPAAINPRMPLPSRGV